MIRLVDELPTVTGAVALFQNGEKVAGGTYFKCPKSGDVTVAIHEHDDIDAAKSLKLILDDGVNSTYEGNFQSNGDFSLFRS